MIALHEDRLAKHLNTAFCYLLKIRPRSVKIEYDIIAQVEGTYRSTSPTASSHSSSSSSITLNILESYFQI